jgi:antitoxin component YwqK of YwqJK toxin-antitoxin module
MKAALFPKTSSILYLSLLSIVLLVQLGCRNNSEKQSGDQPSSIEETHAKPAVAPQDIAVESHSKKDPDGNILSFFTRKGSDLKEGREVKTSPKGVVLEEADYFAGQLEGNRIIYTAKGDTQIVETYRHGLFEGPYRLYYPSGKLKMKGQYVANNMDGIWYQYYEGGSVKEAVTFSDNEENGPFKEYHPNGKLSVEGQYLHGDTEHGPLKFYDENGVHIKTMQCKEGICRTVWKLDKKGS